MGKNVLLEEEKYYLLRLGDIFSLRKKLLKRMFFVYVLRQTMVSKMLLGYNIQYISANSQKAFKCTRCNSIIIL